MEVPDQGPGGLCLSLAAMHDEELIRSRESKLNSRARNPGNHPRGRETSIVRVSSGTQALHHLLYWRCYAGWAN